MLHHGGTERRIKNKHRAEYDYERQIIRRAGGYDRGGRGDEYDERDAQQQYQIPDARFDYFILFNVRRFFKQCTPFHRKSLEGLNLKAFLYLKMQGCAAF